MTSWGPMYQLDRRTTIGAAATDGIAQLAASFVVTARGADEIKFGLGDSYRRPHRRDHRQRLLLEGFPVLQFDADGDQFGLEDHVRQIQGIVFDHHGLRGLSLHIKCIN